MQFLPGGKKTIEIAAKLKSFGLALEPTTLWGHLQAGNVDDLQALKKSLEALDDAGLKITVPTPDVTGPDAMWLTLQRRVDIDALRERLGTKKH